MTQGELYADRYELERPLGRGGMGEVWLAQDRELEVDVALKFLKDSFSDEHTEMLRREVRQTRNLTHRHVLRIYDFVRPPEARAAISMEYAPGGTVGGLVSREKPFLEVSQLEGWIFEACDALSYLHEECGIVHRDVKPGNMMLDASNRLKLADFGLSAGTAMQIDEVSQETIGNRLTLHYASPQLLWNPYESHHLNDIYALGVTIFLLLTGTFPFRDPKNDRWKWDPDNLLSVSERREAKDREGEAIPEHWDYAVARCLAEDPLDRPQSARELSALLGNDPDGFEIGSEETTALPAYTTVSLPPVEKEMGPIRKTGRLLWIITVAGAFGLLSGILWGLFTIWDEKAPESARPETPEEVVETAN